MRAIRPLLIDRVNYVKKYVVSASLVAGLSMISGTAFAQTSGSVGANYARADFGGGDADVYGVDAEVVFPTGGSWAAILEAEYADTEGGDGTLSAGGHLISRDNVGAWGGFARLSDNDGGNAYVIGGEYAAFFDSSTFAGSLSYGSVDDTDVDAWGLAGVYRIFANDDLRFDIDGGWSTVDAGGPSADVWNIGAGVEYRFAGSPFAIGAGYSHIDGDGPEADIIGVTGRIYFGDNSLKEADRKGNTFSGVGNALSGLF